MIKRRTDVPRLEHIILQDLQDLVEGERRVHVEAGQLARARARPLRRAADSGSGGGRMRRGHDITGEEWRGQDLGWDRLWGAFLGRFDDNRGWPGALSRRQSTVLYGKWDQE